MPIVQDFGTSLRLGNTILAAALLVAAALPATAADTADPCVVAPGEEAATVEQKDLAASATTECDGLLKPAPVGDRELVEPAPETGKMPVLDPEDVPVQPVPDDD